MKKIFYYFSFSLLLLVNGCHSDKAIDNNDIKLVSIDPDNYDDFIDISPYLDDSIHIVRLQTTDNCLLSQIKKIAVQDDRIFISDNLQSGVYVFDISGKFIKKIGNTGAGPGEFLYMQDFTVMGRNSICIHDLYGFKNITYDVDSGTFSEVAYGKELYHLETIMFDDIRYYVSNYFVSELGSYNLYRIDQKNKIEPLLPFNEKTAKKVTWVNGNYSSKYKDKSLLIYPMNDTVYEISKQGVQPRYKVSFSKRYIPDELLESGETDLFVRSRRDNFITGFDYFQNSKEYILVRYVDNNLFRYLLLDKETLNYQIGESFIVSGFGNMNLYNYYTGENDELITYLDAETFKSNWAAGHERGVFRSPETQKAFESVAAKIQEEDNPVIMILKFK